MSFFQSMFANKASDLSAQLKSAITNIDPVGATEAEITDMTHNVDMFAKSAADAKAKVDVAQATVDSLKNDKTRYVSAITLEMAKTPQNETLINKLMSNAEDVKTKLVTAEAALTATQSHASTSLSNHRAAVDKLSKMRQELTEAQSTLEEAKAEAVEAATRKREAEVAANILKPSSNSSALELMKQHAAELKSHIAADNMTADALTHKPDDDVAAALAAVSAPAPAMSAQERLAALGG